MNHNQRGITGIYTLTALIALAIGAAIFAYQLNEAFRLKAVIIDEMVRAPIPGTMTFDAQAGELTLFIEQPPADKRELRRRPASLTCVALDTNTDQTFAMVDLLAAETNVDPSLFARGLADPDDEIADVPLYDTETVSAYGSWQITLDQPASILITTTVDADDLPEHPLTLAAGQSNLRDLLNELISGATALTLGFTACVIILVIGYMRTTQDRTPRSQMPPPPGVTE
ncbi:hypothetical protein [Mucisphaera calidilacus]|uniref:Uncharacterized protein n=1 Tax=Mucisphaera calidilacus TaxID=2527982 RepID=A0A518BWB5_9BACT|nr:hypothetical protein [Mucisphaera calidilacus]QDU71214.1 hypothetical protein Pan265_10630 [Mucisphaera calidilacus]